MSETAIGDSVVFTDNYGLIPSTRFIKVKEVRRSNLSRVRIVLTDQNGVIHLVMPGDEINGKRVA